MDQGLAKALDQMQICEVRRVWAFSLDLGEWDTLQACFHPDAKVTVSWYSGPIGGFIERSKTLVAARKPEEHRKHWLGNMRTMINGTRAVLETDVQILIREFIDGDLCDYTSLGALLRPVREARRGLADFRVELHLRQGPAGSGDPLVGCIRLVRQGGA